MHLTDRGLVVQPRGKAYLQWSQVVFHRGIALASWGYCCFLRQHYLDTLYFPICRHEMYGSSMSEFPHADVYRPVIDDRGPSPDRGMYRPRTRVLDTDAIHAILLFWQSNVLHLCREGAVE